MALKWCYFFRIMPNPPKRHYGIQEIRTQRSTVTRVTI